MNEPIPSAPPFDLERAAQLLDVLRRYREGKRSVDARLPL